MSLNNFGLNTMELYRNINEPAEGFKDIIDFTKYPDMEEAHDYMEKIVGHPNFILTSGCENAIRITLEVERLKSLTWCKPSWGMMDSFVKMFNINPLCTEFIYKNKQFYEQVDNNAEGFYSCYGINNYLSYNRVEDTDSFKLVIQDITYYKPDVFNTIRPKDNEIFVGSFDKYYGCGLRLGFIIFPKYKSDIYYLHRERYINSGAVKALINYVPKKFSFIPLNYPLICHNEIYSVYEGVCSEYGARNFKVGNNNFFRVNNGETNLYTNNRTMPDEM